MYLVICMCSQNNLEETNFIPLHYTEKEAGALMGSDLQRFCEIQLTFVQRGSTYMRLFSITVQLALYVSGFHIHGIFPSVVAGTCPCRGPTECIVLCHFM